MVKEPKRLTREVEAGGAVEGVEDVVGEEGGRREEVPLPETVTQQEVGQDGRRQPGHGGGGGEAGELLLLPSSGLLHQVAGVDTLPEGQRSQQVTSLTWNNLHSVVHVGI